MPKQNLRIIIIAAIVFIAALSRIIPHPMNVAPLGAMALFGAAYFGNRGLGLLITMIAWFVGDLILNNLIYPASGFTLFTSGAFFIYTSIVLMYVFGALMFRKSVSLPKVIGASISVSILFFVVSNFGVWMSGQLYPMNMAGLVTCYTAAIPFFHNTLLGDLVYSGLLFLIYDRIYLSLLASQKVK